ncbi:MAG: hypothetical protein OQK82_05515 [Candidatus Pacearchaeota archaeon]|nr:hypothetical protein [Candidatus Pacearchaeota archaeon]
MAKEGQENEFEEKVYFALGILSVVLAFFNPLASFVCGVLGISYSRKNKGYFQKKTKKFSVVGIILSILMIFFYIGAQAWILQSGLI